MSTPTITRPGSEWVQEAKQYAQRGWGVLALQTPTPDGRCSCGKDDCDQPGKHPRWHGDDLPNGCHSATTSPELLATWAKRWPQANIGVATGAKSDFWVLDVDSDEGRETLHALEKQHGELPRTVRQITGGAGEHILFAYVPGLTNAVKFAPGLDVRTDGGLIVVSPSLHSSGRRYEWDAEFHPDEVPIAPAPPWLVELIQAGATAQKKEALQPGETISTGARNTTLFHEGVRLLRLKIADDAVLGALKEINLQRCTEPLAQKEVEGIVTSAKRYLKKARERAKTRFKPPAPTDADAPPEYRSYPLPSANGNHASGMLLPPAEEPGDADEADPDGTLTKKLPPLDQLKYARAFAQENEGRLMYVDGDQWWEYQNKHWRYTGETMTRSAMQHFLMAQDTLRSAQITAAKVKSTLELAGPLLGPVRVDDLNPHRTWIPLKNGVYDTVTGDFFKHSPAHRFTYCLPYDYDSTADCPQIKAFFRQVLIGTNGRPCREWIEFMEEWFGICFIPDNRAQATLVNVGEGGNGKGVTTRLLQRAVGAGQHTAIDVEMLHDPYHRASLVGKLVGFINEPSRRALEKNGGRLKDISGGDEISARNPCERVFSFLPTTRLVVSCNDLPSTRDLSRGYFRRLILIEWRFRPEKPDTELDGKLATELPGLFNLAMAGLKRFRARNNRFADLPESDRLKEDYQKSQDTTAQFLDEVCVQAEGVTAVPAELYRAYTAWCKVKGYRAPLNDNAFGQRLSHLGVKPSKVIPVEGRDKARVRPGIALEMGELQAVLGPTEWRRFNGEG